MLFKVNGCHYEIMSEQKWEDTYTPLHDRIPAPISAIALFTCYRLSCLFHSNSGPETVQLDRRRQEKTLWLAHLPNRPSTSRTISGRHICIGRPRSRKSELSFLS